MHYLRSIFRWRPTPMVRPWALGGPILILLICLPLLRPVRHPDPRDISYHEQARLATVEAIVEHRTLAIDDSSFRVPQEFCVYVGEQRFAAQPATMSLLLAGAYWVMHRFGLSFAENGPTVSYVLTLLGVTLPVAAVAGLVYRMARLFELRRPWRAALGLACVIATGLISYGTVLNPHAPSAVLVLCAVGCLIHVAAAKSPKRQSPWLIVAGFCATLAATIDPPSMIFTVLLAPMVLALRWPVGLRLSGLLLYAIGAIPPIALHAALTVPITGDFYPPSLHGELRRHDEPRPIDLPPPVLDTFDEEDITASPWQIAAGKIGRVLAALVGSHGLLSHFPILLLGAIGVGKIMHRHWPTSTKMLAAATLLGSAVIVLVFALTKSDWRDAMFAARWFVVFTPLTLFWAGSWLRKHHGPVKWTFVAIGLVFSTAVSLIGATGVWPREGFSGYTVVGATKNLFTQDHSVTTRDAVARR